MRKVLSIVVILLIPTVLIYFILNLSDLKAFKPKPVANTSYQSNVTVSRGGVHKSDGLSKLDITNTNAVVIRAMTYNIHRGINKSGKLNLEDISSIIKASQVDIIAIQEIERHSIRTGFKDQIEILANNLSMEYVYGKSINILNGKYGNAILSRYPIEEYEVFELPYEGERRTLLRALININGYKLYAFSTHLGLDISERETQIEAIKAAIGELELDYILMGDFNSSSDKLNSIREISVDVANNLNEEQINTYESDKYSERIDYIFVSSNFIPLSYNVIKSEASDHYPVVAEIQSN